MTIEAGLFLTLLLTLLVYFLNRIDANIQSIRKSIEDLTARFIRVETEHNNRITEETKCKLK